MGAKIGGDDDAIAEINIVPFVDIILVVLIIFMVTTPFIMKPSINVNLPKAASGEESSPAKLNVSITNDGQLTLNGQPTNLDDFCRQRCFTRDCGRGDRRRQNRRSQKVRHHHR